MQKILFEQTMLRKHPQLPAVMGVKFNLHTYLQSSYCSIFRQMSNLISQWRGTERNLSSTCLTFCIQHLGDVQVLFSNIKGGVQISHWGRLSESKLKAWVMVFHTAGLYMWSEVLVMSHLAQFTVINELRTMSVNECTEAQSILPTDREKDRKRM